MTKSILADLMEKIFMTCFFKQGSDSICRHKFWVYVDCLLLFLHLFVCELSYFYLNLKTHAIFVFDVLWWTKTFKLTIYHYSDFSTKSFSFFHWMSCKYNCAFLSQSWDVRNNCPHKTFCLWINTSWWFIKQYYWRVSD